MVQVKEYAAGMNEPQPFRLPDSVRRTLSALAPVLLTEEVEDLGLIDTVVDGVELFLRSVPATVRVGLVSGLTAFEHAARLRPGSAGRGFSALPRHAAERHFQRWWASSLPPKHELARGVKMILVHAYYELPVIEARLGYQPQACVDAARTRRLGRFSEAIRAHQEQVLQPSPLPAADVPTGRRGGGR